MKDFAVWFLGVLTFMAFMVVIGFEIFTDKRITFYYTSIDSGRTNTTCVYGYRPWWNDERCFCSDDVNKVLDVLGKLNVAKGVK